MHCSGGKILPNVLSQPMYAFPFYFVGSYLKKPILNASRKWLFAISALCAISPFVAASYYPFIDLHGAKFGDNIFLYYLFGIAGSLFVLGFCRLFADIKNNVVITLSTGSILVLALHGLIFRWVNIYTGMAFKLFIALAVMLVLYYPIKFVQRRCPIILGNRNNIKSLSS